MEDRKKILLAGGSGFTGSLLENYFGTSQYEVVVLTRSVSSTTANSGTRKVQWDGRTRGDWCKELEGAYALINLSGKSVDCRYHARNRSLLFSSRLESTRVLGEAIAHCIEPPRVWLNASTATIYEHTYGPAHGEDGRIDVILTTPWGSTTLRHHHHYLTLK